MGWNNDQHGLVFKPSEVKLYFDGGHTYKMKIGTLSRSEAVIRILTYSLPDLSYIIELFQKRPHSIYIICHDKFKDKAKEIKQTFPNIRVATNCRIHSKILLRSPDTIYLGSTNFGMSKWHESGVGIRSKAAHDEFLRKSFEPLWLASEEIEK
jgi:PLD-like domain